MCASKRRPRPPTPGPVSNDTIAGAWFQGTVTTFKRVFTKRPGDDYWLGTGFLLTGNPRTWKEAGAITLRDLGNGFLSYSSGSNPNAPRWKLTGGTLQELNLDGKTPFGPAWHR